MARESTPDKEGRRVLLVHPPMGLKAQSPDNHEPLLCHAVGRGRPSNLDGGCQQREETDGYNKSQAWNWKAEMEERYTFAEWKFLPGDTFSFIVTQFPEESRLLNLGSRQRRHPFMSQQMT